MKDANVSWQRRFANFKNALDKLSEAVDYYETYDVDKEIAAISYSAEVIESIVKDGLICRFNNTHELAWKVMKGYALSQGVPNIEGRREATREALQLQIITDGVLWMDMITSRQKTSAAYDDEIAKLVNSRIRVDYYTAFLDFRDTMMSQSDL